MGPVPLLQIEGAIKKGCLKAVKSYEEISGGLWLSWAPEFYIQSCIFQALGKLDGLLITMESSHKHISRDTDIIFREKFLKEARLGRFDLVVWYLKNMPRAIVEVKKFY